MILLATSGHGFEVIEELEIIEVNQEAHPGEENKTRIIGVTPDQINIKCRKKL